MRTVKISSRLSALGSRQLRAVIAILIIALAATASAAPAGQVYVIFDGELTRLRWSVPAEGPVAAFRVDRISAGNRVPVATLTPAPAGLPDSDRDLVAGLVEIMKSRQTSPDGRRTHAMLAGLVTARSIIEPRVAVAAGIVFDEKWGRPGDTVAYEIHRIAPGGANTLHAASGPMRMTPTPLPSAPADLTPENERGRITLRWSADLSEGPEAAATYQVMRRDAPGATPKLLTPQPLFATGAEPGQRPRATFVDVAPPVEKTLLYSIVPIDMFGRRGAEGPLLPVLSRDFAALDPPKSVSTASADGKVTLSWTATPSPNRAGWLVERATDGMSATAILTSAPVKGTTFVDSDVLAGTTYYYRVTAVNGRGESGAASIAEPVRVVSKPPAAPRALKAEAKLTRVSLAWEAANDRVAGFVVERAIGSDEWAVANARPVINARFDDEIVSGIGGTLRYRVFAVGFDGTRSAASNVVDATLIDSNPPAAPVITSIDGAGARVSVTIGGSRNSGSSPDTIVLLRSRTPAETGIVSGEQKLASESVTVVDREVESGVAYYYRAVAVDAAGNRSEPSEANMVIVLAPALAAPPKPVMRVVEKPFPRVVADLPALPGVTLILERKDGEQWILVAGPLRSGDGELADVRPPPGKTAEYRVRAVTPDGVASKEGP